MKTKMWSVLKFVIEAWDTFERNVSRWMEWQDAKSWAKVYYPAWLYLATCKNRPEINTTYRKKIIRAYYDTYNR